MLLTPNVWVYSTKQFFISLWIPTECPEIYFILTLITWNQCRPLKFRGSVPQNCPPLQRQIIKNLPYPGIEPWSPALQADCLLPKLQGKSIRTSQTTK